MEHKDKIVDKQVGRNSDLYAQSIAELKTPEERYPHLRILVSIIEQAHPEWNQAPHKDRQVANIVFKMSRAAIGVEEVAEIVRLRDAERGYGPIQEDERPGRSRNTESSEGDDRVSNSKSDAANAAKVEALAEAEKAKDDSSGEEKEAPRSRARKRPAAEKAEASSDDAPETEDKAAETKDGTPSEKTAAAKAPKKAAKSVKAAKPAKAAKPDAPAKSAEAKKAAESDESA